MSRGKAASIIKSDRNWHKDPDKRDTVFAIVSNEFGKCVRSKKRGEVSVAPETIQVATLAQSCMASGRLRVPKIIDKVMARAADAAP